MDPQTKLENNYDQNTLQFYKILIITPYVSTGAQHLEKGDGNDAKNDKIKEHFEHIRNDLR